MISMLYGYLGGMEDDGALTIQVGNSVSAVGYRVVVNDRDRDRINVKGVAGEVGLFCRTIVTESEQTIFGFLEQNDRRIFDRLLKVKGCGPATSLRLLSKMDHGMITACVMGKAIADLCKVPGIGKVMAQKIVDGVKL